MQTEEVLKHILGELRGLRTGQKAQGLELKELRTELEAQGLELKELRTGLEAQGQELKELRTEQQAQGLELKELRTGLDTLRTDFRKLSMHVEHEITDKIRALYDHREIVDERLERVEGKLDDHDERLVIHLQEIANLKARAR